MGKNTLWTTAETETLRSLWMEGMLGGEIADCLAARHGTRRIRHAVFDKAGKMGLPPRVTPSGNRVCRRSRRQAAAIAGDADETPAADTRPRITLPVINALAGMAFDVVDPLDGFTWSPRAFLTPAHDARKARLMAVHADMIRRGKLNGGTPDAYDRMRP